MPELIGGAATLDAALADLAAECPADMSSLESMREQLRSLRVRVLVIGEAKRGKSSLINALVGCPLLPVGVTPVTAVLTEVRSGDVASAEVHFADGRRSPVGTEMVYQYVAEAANPGNRRGVASVVVTIEETRWPRSLVLIDTPGTGSVHSTHESTTVAAMTSMDVAVLVLTADPPISGRERAQLVEASSRSVRLVAVLAKTDLISEEELPSVIDYTEQVIADAVGTRLAVVPVSTRRTSESTAAVESVDRLRQILFRLATQDSEQTVVSSLRNRAFRLATRVRAEIDISRSLAEMQIDAAEERAAAFNAALDAALEHRRFCAETVAAGVQQLLSELGRAAADARQQTNRRLRDIVAATPQSRPVDRRTEDALVNELGQAAVVTAQEWRHVWAQRLQDGLQAIADRTSAQLEAALSAVEGAAAELFGVALKIVPEPVRLPEDLRFFYSTTSQPDTATVISTTIRRHLPAGMRRRASAAYLNRTVDELADRHIGRARGDLQQRLTEARRTLVAQVERHSEDLLRRLRVAANVATVEAHDQHSQVERAAAITERLSRLDRIIDRVGTSG